MQPALMLWQKLRSTRFRFSEVTRTSASRTSSSRTDSANPLRLSWGAVFKYLCATVLQFLDTTARRETSAKGRWVAKNEKSGSNASSSFDRMSTSFHCSLGRTALECDDIDDKALVRDTARRAPRPSLAAQ